MNVSEGEYVINLPVIKGWTLLILTGLLIFWIRGEYVAIGKYFDPFFRLYKMTPDYYVKWFIWSAVGVPLIRGWLWNLIGYESIAISNDSLLLKSQIGPFKRIRRLKMFGLSNLRNEAALSPRILQQFGWGGTLKIEYEGCVHWFGLLLSENEAEQIADALRMRIPNLRQTA